MNDQSKTRAPRQRSNQLGKLLAYLLRHAPGRLEVDPGGWVRVDALLEVLAERGHAIDRPTLEAEVATDAKQRYTLSADVSRIRAAQGHSIDVDLGLTPLVPLPYSSTAPPSASWPRSSPGYRLNF